MIFGVMQNDGLTALRVDLKAVFYLGVQLDRPSSRLLTGRVQVQALPFPRAEKRNNFITGGGNRHFLHLPLQVSYSLANTPPCQGGDTGSNPVTCLGLPAHLPGKPLLGCSSVRFRAAGGNQRVASAQARSRTGSPPTIQPLV